MFFNWSTTMAPYRPKPIDTTGTVLNATHERLIEQLTENVHEIWAAKRMADGWTVGAKRNDDKKQHPCLVPYDDLPESEKAYDREIVDQTIKAMLALGYKISRR